MSSWRLREKELVVEEHGSKSRRHTVPVPQFLRELVWFVFVSSIAEQGDVFALWLGDEPSGFSAS